MMFCAPCVISGAGHSPGEAVYPAVYVATVLSPSVSRPVQLDKMKENLTIRCTASLGFVPFAERFCCSASVSGIVCNIYHAVKNIILTVNNYNCLIFFLL